MKLTHVQPRDVLVCERCSLVQSAHSSGRCLRCRRNLNVSYLDLNLTVGSFDPSQSEWSSFPIRLGSVLRQLRLRRGISQSALARILRMSRSELSKAESGRVLLPFRRVLLLATRLGADQVTIRFRDLPP